MTYIWYSARAATALLLLVILLPGETLGHRVLKFLDHVAHLPALTVEGVPDEVEAQGIQQRIVNL